MKQLILGTGTAIWWLTEPHFVNTACMRVGTHWLNSVTHFDTFVNYDKMFMKSTNEYTLKARLYYDKYRAKLVGPKEQKKIFCIFKICKLSTVFAMV
jgi:hypothetical protein